MMITGNFTFSYQICTGRFTKKCEVFCDLYGHCVLSHSESRAEYDNGKRTAVL